MKTITLEKGDPCPACGDAFVKATVPTDEQYRKAFDKENPVSLSPWMDTASPEDRAELGELYRCGRCGYQTRFKADAGAAAAKPQTATA